MNSDTIEATATKEQKEIVARMILRDLQRRDALLQQASGGLWCGVSYAILTFALIGIGVWQPEGWLVAAGVLILIGIVLHIELRGVNRRMDALVEMQVQLGRDLNKIQGIDTSGAS